MAEDIPNMSGMPLRYLAPWCMGQLGTTLPSRQVSNQGTHKRLLEVHPMEKKQVKSSSLFIARGVYFSSAPMARMTWAISSALRVTRTVSTASAILFVSRRLSCGALNGRFDSCIDRLGQTNSLGWTDQLGRTGGLYCPSRVAVLYGHVIPVVE